jgi:hypothetical protein
MTPCVSPRTEVRSEVLSIVVSGGSKIVVEVIKVVEVVHRVRIS